MPAGLFTITRWTSAAGRGLPARARSTTEDPGRCSAPTELSCQEAHHDWPQRRHPYSGSPGAEHGDLVRRADASQPTDRHEHRLRRFTSPHGFRTGNAEWSCQVILRWCRRCAQVADCARLSAWRRRRPPLRRRSPSIRYEACLELLAGGTGQDIQETDHRPGVHPLFADDPDPADYDCQVCIALSQGRFRQTLPSSTRST